MIIDAIIKIEVACKECNGSGRVRCEGEPSHYCSDCDGTGYSETHVTLEKFKRLLEGEKL